MNKIIAVALNTFLETRRDKILYSFFVFAIIMILSSLVFSTLSAEQYPKIVKDFGLTAISLFSILISIFLGTGLVYKEIEKKTVYNIFSKPIERYQFLTGKYLGIAITILVIMLLMSLIFLGIVLLIKGADYLVKGSSSLAKKLGIPTLIIGLTIVALGTSTPELVVNILAALKGSTEVAFGNIIGSNIANILLVLGIVAIIYPIKVESSTIWKEIPFALLGVVVLFVASNYFLIDKITINSLTRVSGIIFLCFFIIINYYAFGLAKRHKVQLDQGKKEVIKHQDIDIEKHKNISIFLMVLGGLIGLYFGGKWVVEGAIFMAQQLGLSEFLISVTIIAIGTSLPELVTGITAAKKKDTELAVGNSVGSNIFNIFWILGITAIIAPIAIPNFINLDIAFLGIATFLLFIALFIEKKHELER